MFISRQPQTHNYTSRQRILGYVEEHFRDSFVFRSYNDQKYMQPNNLLDQSNYR